ncbi:MAG: hypothetical protein ACR2PF_08270 [Rhizobiaceae bacterium]
MAEAEKKVWTVDALAKLASGNRREAEDVRVGENALPMPGASNDPNANRTKQTAGELLEKIQGDDGTKNGARAEPSMPEKANSDQPLSKSTDDTINKFKQLMQQNKKAASIARQPTGEKLEAGNALLRKAKQESSKLADITALAKGADAFAAKPAVAEPTAADAGTDAKGDTKIDEKKLEEFLKEKGEEELVEPHKSDESALDIDFFKLRRNMRFLQFQCEVGNSYNQEMREQFSEALQAFSRINVRYKEMHQRDAERLDLVSQVEKARLDLIDISDAKTRSEAELARTKASVDSNRKEHQAAVSELEMDRDSARAEADGARAEIDAQKNEISALKQEIAELRVGSADDREKAALFEAETSVLRDALSEACDTIAQDMAARMMHESLLQELEDKVAQLEHEATMAGR